jgi:hypothetical protein
MGCAMLQIYKKAREIITSASVHALKIMLQPSGVNVITAFAVALRHEQPRI